MADCVYHIQGDSRQRDAAQEASAEAKVERSSSTCHHAGGLKVEARTLLAETRSAGNEETWTALVANFSSEDDASISAAEVEEDPPPRCCAQTMSMPPTCFSKSFTPEAPYRAPFTTVSGSCTCCPSSTPTSGGRSPGRGTTTFRQRVVDKPDVSLPEFWRRFSQSSFTSLGESVGSLA